MPHKKWSTSAIIQLLVAGIFSAEYSYISERVVQLFAPPTNPAAHLREKFLL